MFLKNRNISSKIKRSKVTDYAALKVIAENQCEKHKKSSLIVYNASKDSVISMLGNTLIPIFVFDRKKTLSLSLSN